MRNSQMDDIQPNQILFEDSWLIALNKPSGRFTQAAYGVPNLQVDVQQYLQHRDKSDEQPFVGIIHRLDRPTSGVLLFGRSATAVRRMNEQFRERLPTKSYLALVNGIPDTAGTAVDWMRKIDDVAKAELCDASDDGAKEAVLHWTRLASDDRSALLKVTLETGRMHQIRLQLASRGHPIVGDALYSNDSSTSSDTRTNELFGLHAAELIFRHPKTAKQMTLQAPLPSIWQMNFPWISSQARD